MQPNLVKLAVADGIAVVTMDNPPVNAQNAQFNLEMAYVFDALSDRKDARVAILTGAGKVFSAGADMKSRAGLAEVGSARSTAAACARASMPSANAPSR